MSFYWLSHGTRVNDELANGYMWSPKTKSNGARNENYLNLSRAQPGDIVISFANTRFRAVGIVSEIASDAPNPDTKSGSPNWNVIGWRVPVRWRMLTMDIRPRDYAGILLPLMPDHNYPFQMTANGPKGTQGVYLAAISDLAGGAILDILSERESTLRTDLANLDLDEPVYEQQHIGNDQAGRETERDQYGRRRIGQARFRRNVEAIERRCRVTHTTRREFLTGSHIKPWNKCNDVERLDGENGFLLAPHVDRLFDRGFISFSDEGEILVAHPVITETLQQWQINPSSNVGEFTAGQKWYLRYHREHIFTRGQNLLHGIL